jgi:hypothetical protein
MESFCAYKKPWYIEQKKEAENLALKLGFSKVAQAKVQWQIKFEISLSVEVLCLPCALQPIALILHWQADICEPILMVIQVIPIISLRWITVILLLSKILFRAT